MTLFLNQLFYPCNTFDNIDSLKRLESFMLTHSLIDKKMELVKEPVKKVVKEVRKEDVKEVVK